MSSIRFVSFLCSSDPWILGSVVQFTFTFAVQCIARSTSPQDMTPRVYEGRAGPLSSTSGYLHWLPDGEQLAIERFQYICAQVRSYRQDRAPRDDRDDDIFLGVPEYMDLTRESQMFVDGDFVDRYRDHRDRVVTAERNAANRRAQQFADCRRRIRRRNALLRSREGMARNGNTSGPVTPQRNAPPTNARNTSDDDSTSDSSHEEESEGWLSEFEEGLMDLIDNIRRSRDSSDSSRNFRKSLASS